VAPCTVGLPHPPQHRGTVATVAPWHFSNRSTVPSGTVATVATFALRRPNPSSFSSCQAERHVLC